jgi:branched-chain amino acid transport system permease protein
VTVRSLLTGPMGRWVGAVAALVVGGVVAAAVLPAGLPAGIALYGVLLGVLDGLTAMGLVLVYRTARVVNFAQADIGGLAAAVAVVLVTGAHLPWLVAVLLGLGTGLLSGVAVDALVVRRFERSPRLVLTVATIGLAQLFGAGELGLPALFPHLSPLSTFTTPFSARFSVGPVVFDGNAVVAFAVVPLVLGGLWWFFDRTDTGIALRGAADDRERASLLGIPVRRLSATAWTLAAGLSALGAILSAPILGPNLGAIAGPPALLVPLAAAVVAGLESLPGALLAAVVIDVFQQAVLWSYPRSSTVDVALFGLVLVAVVVRRRRLSRRGGDRSLGQLGSAQDRPLPAAVTALRPVAVGRVALPAVGVAAAALVPIGLSAAHLTILTAIVIDGIVAVSMVVLVGWAGQLSLGQYAFVGLGASTAGALLVHARADLLLALLASAAVGGVAALLIGLPSLRVPGLFLGVVTMAFAVPVSTWLLDSSYFPTLTPSLVPRPVLFGRISLDAPLALYELCLAVLVLVLLAVHRFRRSRIGRLVLAVRDNDRAAAGFGASPTRVRLVAFVCSGTVAGVAGALVTLNLRGVPFSGFNPEQSIVVFTMVIVGGMGSVTGALLGAAYVEAAQYFLGGAAQLLATGAGLLVLLALLPGGLGEALRRGRDRVMRELARRRGIEVPSLERRPIGETGSPGPTAPEGVAGPGRQRRVASRRQRRSGAAGLLASRHRSASGATGVGYVGPVLECEGIDAAYGELQVLFGAELAVSAGEATALLGVNGSGKSTLLNVVAGVLPARAGTVRLRGVDVTEWPAERRVGAGLAMVPGGRGVFPSLTVAENLRLGGWLLRKDRQLVAARTDLVLRLFPALAHRLDLAAGELSGGEQQMLALAQALLVDPEVLLVDELSLGLAPTVVASLLEVLRQRVAQGMALVVVEQSINVAATIAPTARFLERGQLRYHGPTAELARRPDLARAVFLGASPVDGTVPCDAETDRIERHRVAGADVEPRCGDGASEESTCLGGAGVGRAATVQVAPSGPDAHGTGGGCRAVACAEPGDGAVLALKGVSVAFGGVRALTDIDLAVGSGEIVGLIGANGAGKTTLLDVASGFLAARTGRVRLGGLDVTSLAPAARARLGLGRLFQDAALFPSLTVLETVTVACERHLEVRDPIALTLGLADARRSEADARLRTEDLIDALGLRPYADACGAELSTGTRRIVELACALAHEPSVLLADEPSSGIAQREVEALGRLLLQVRDETGAALVVVDHDVALLGAIADRLVCLHLGQVLAVGTPAQVLADDAVVGAYLGTDHVTLARSG